MTIKSNLTGTGIAPAAATQIVGNVANTLTATGSSSQTNSYAIQTDISIFTSAAGNTGARLPSTASAGDTFTIANLDGNTMLVYPPSGGVINGGSTNASVSLTTKKCGTFICIDGTNYLGEISA